MLQAGWGVEGEGETNQLFTSNPAAVMEGVVVVVVRREKMYGGIEISEVRYENFDSVG